MTLRGILAALVVGLSCLLLFFSRSADSASPNNFPSPGPSGSLARAQDFVNSIGVNLHIEDGGIYAPTPLFTMLTQTGITHLRDTTAVATSYTSLAQSIHSTFGAEFDWIMFPADTRANILNYINTVGTASTEAYEGPNECDISGQSPCNGSSYPTVIATSMATMYPAVRSVTSNIAVLGPSIAGPTSDYTAVGDLSSYMDYMVGHFYMTWRQPENTGWGGGDACGVYGALTWNICWAQVVGVGKQVSETETGYGNLYDYDQVALGGGDSVTNSVFPFTAADFEARLLTYGWYRGVPRIYLFELGDGATSPGYETHGLYDQFGKARPMGTEIANIIAALKDTGGTATTFTPSNSLGISITDPSGGYHLLLEKSNGEFDVVYWLGCQSYYGQPNVIGDCAPESATQTLTSLPSSIINSSLNNNGGGEETHSTLVPASSMTLSYTEHVQIERLNPVGNPTFATPSPTSSPYPAQTDGPGLGNVSIRQETGGYNGGFSGQYTNYWYTFASGASYTKGVQPPTNDFMLIFSDGVSASLTYSGPNVAYASVQPGWVQYNTPYSSLTQSANCENGQTGVLGYCGLMTSNTSPANSISGWTLGAYASNASTGSTNNFPWVEGGGGYWQYSGYDFQNVDQSYPIGADALTTWLANTTPTCPSVTAPRTGSLVMCQIVTENGAAATNPPTGITAGWRFESLASQLNGVTGAIEVFSYGPTTTSNQVVPANTPTLGGSSAPTYGETIAIQPPSQLVGAANTTICKVYTMHGAVPATCGAAQGGIHKSVNLADNGNTYSESNNSNVTGCSSPGTLTNGTEYAASFTPFSCTASAWNVRLPASPTIASWSTNVTNIQFQNANQGASGASCGGCAGQLLSIWSGNFDVGHNYYYAATSDPLVNINCVGDCATDNGGVPATIRIPAKGHFPTSTTDNHIVVIQPTTGPRAKHEIDLYRFGSGQTGSGPGGDWASGDTITASAGDCGDWTTGSGFYTSAAVTAGNQCSIAGIMRANELENGYINHALVMILDCSSNPGGTYFVAPVLLGDTNHCTNGGYSGPPLGGRLWYDNTCTATQGPVTSLNFTNAFPGTTPTPSELAILCAANQHGIIFTDDYNGAPYAGGFSLQSDGGTMFTAYGNASPYAALAASPNNWTTQAPVTGATSPRYIGGDPWNPSGFTAAYWKAHWKYLDPCESTIPRSC